MIQRALRTGLAVGAVAALTYASSRLLHVNAPTVGFAYLLLVLVFATTFGFFEAAVASFVATFAFNYYFLPPVGTLTIADPENWVALFAFLTTGLIASRLSAAARNREREAIERQNDLERLYTFSRTILLIGDDGPFAKQLADSVASVFQLEAVALYDRADDVIYRSGPQEFDSPDHEFREVARHGTSLSDPNGRKVITAVRLGADPIGSLGIQGSPMPDSVLQGMANLVAIGLERARAQEMSKEIDAARRSEQLRATLLDAMAHEFKTPLTSIKAATTSLLADPDQPPATELELIRVANEEAQRLEHLIDDSIEMARLDTPNIEVQPEMTDAVTLARDVVLASHAESNGRSIKTEFLPSAGVAAMDRRLVALALRQLVDNALKYSPPSTDVTIRVSGKADSVSFEVVDQGIGIPQPEQMRIFDRFYRSTATKDLMPGSGLGLSIAQRIVQAHHGELNLESRPGATTFRITLPRGIREATA